MNIGTAGSRGISKGDDRDNDVDSYWEVSLEAPSGSVPIAELRYFFPFVSPITEHHYFFPFVSPITERRYFFPFVSPIIERRYFFPFPHHRARLGPRGCSWRVDLVATVVSARRNTVHPRTDAPTHLGATFGGGAATTACSGTVAGSKNVVAIRIIIITRAGGFRGKKVGIDGITMPPATMSTATADRGTPTNSTSGSTAGSTSDRGRSYSRMVSARAAVAIGGS